MKTETKLIPDFEIKSNTYQFDRIDIYVLKNKVEFHVAMDGTGDVFTIKKDKLKELLK